MDPIPTKVYNEIYEKTKLDVDGRIQNSSTRREEFGLAMTDFVNFSNEIPGFIELSAKDKANLVKGDILYARYMYILYIFCVKETLHIGEVINTVSVCFNMQYLFLLSSRLYKLCLVSYPQT